MATKQEELQRGCFAKAENNEPLFVLRATDMLAPGLVRQWAAAFAVHYLAHGVDRESWVRKYDEAMELAAEMEDWHRRKLPD